MFQATNFCISYFYENKIHMNKPMEVSPQHKKNPKQNTTQKTQNKATHDTPQKNKTKQTDIWIMSLDFSMSPELQVACGFWMKPQLWFS